MVNVVADLEREDAVRHEVYHDYIAITLQNREYSFLSGSAYYNAIGYIDELFGKDALRNIKSIKITPLAAIDEPLHITKEMYDELINNKYGYDPQYLEIFKLQKETEEGTKDGE